MGDGGTVMAVGAGLGHPVVLTAGCGLTPTTLLAARSHCRAGLISGNKSLKVGIYQALLGQGARPALHQGARLLQRLLNTTRSALHCLVVSPPPQTSQAEISDRLTLILTAFALL